MKLFGKWDYCENQEMKWSTTKLHRGVKTVTQSRLKSPQQSTTARHTPAYLYATRIKVFWKQKESLLCGKIQLDRITKHFSYDVRVWMKVWQSSIILCIFTRVQDSVDFSTLVHFHVNSGNEKWERICANMRNKRDYWFCMRNGKYNNFHHSPVVFHYSQPSR